MLEMARKQLLPAIYAYMSEVANTAASKLAVSEHISVRSEMCIRDRCTPKACWRWRLGW